MTSAFVEKPASTLKSRGFIVKVVGLTLFVVTLLVPQHQVPFYALGLAWSTLGIVAYSVGIMNMPGMDRETKHHMVRTEFIRDLKAMSLVSLFIAGAAESMPFGYPLGVAIVCAATWLYMKLRSRRSDR